MRSVKCGLCGGNIKVGYRLRYLYKLQFDILTVCGKKIVLFQYALSAWNSFYLQNVAKTADKSKGVNETGCLFRVSLLAKQFQKIFGLKILWCFRASDFLKIIEEALRYRQSRGQLCTRLPQFLPISIAVPGLFIEFAILRIIKWVRKAFVIVFIFCYHLQFLENLFLIHLFKISFKCYNYFREKIEILVHRNISNGETLASVENALPLVEFGFQYFFPTVVSKCLQVILTFLPVRPKNLVDYKIVTIKWLNK